MGHFSNYLKHRLERKVIDGSISNFFTSQESSLHRLKYQQRDVHIKKFNLLKNRFLEDQNKYRELRLKKWFKNLSNEVIPVEIAETVALGNKFGIPYNSNKIPSINIVANIEECIKNVVEENKKENVRKVVTDLISNHINNTKFKNSNKTFETVKKFQNDHKDIIFVKADKGNISVAANRNDYNKTVENLLNNNILYKKVNTSLVPTIENKCNDIISRWENKRYINENLAYRLKNHGSVVAKAYALPKVHKPDLKWRLIVSSIGSPTYNLAKFLSKILKPVSGKTHSFIKDSWDFKDKIKNIHVPTTHSLLSLDVVSMFDNIPLDLLSDCIEEKLQLYKNLTKISNSEILIAVRTVFNNTVFSFNQKFYKQISGCPMGSPLSPVASNLVLEDLENRALSKLTFKPLFYTRYVDDIFTIVPTDKIQELINTFNSIDESLQFTFELENNNTLNYLDISIKKTGNGSLITNWYKKQSWSGQYLNYNSHHQFNQKIGLIKGLVDRCIKLSDFNFREENLKELKITLQQNNYPLPLIESVIKERINEIYNSSNNKKDKWLDNYKKTDLHVSLPYVQGLSERLKSALKKFNIIAYFRNNHKLENCFINKKDSEKIENLSNVVYLIKCKGCKKVYIGETGRRLKTRIAEHKRDCRIGNLNTGLSQHSWNFDHLFDFDFDNIKILAKENNTYKRRILESIFINKYKNSSINLKTEILNVTQHYHNIIN